MLFTIDKFENSPSRRCGISVEKELKYRQTTASFIQDIGQKLRVSQLCINTAVVYFQQFFMYHSFTKFNRQAVGGACLFLAAKSEEQPRKLEHVVKAYSFLLDGKSHIDPKSAVFATRTEQLVYHEHSLLLTLGFQVTVEHPHTHVIKACHLFKASKDLTQSAYFLANSSLHLTTLSLVYSPKVVAAVCILLACKWSNWELPPSSEGRHWWLYIDEKITKELLENLTQKFLIILEESDPNRIKSLMAKLNGTDSATNSRTGSPLPGSSTALPGTSSGRPRPPPSAGPPSSMESRKRGPPVEGGASAAGSGSTLPKVAAALPPPSAQLPAGSTSAAAAPRKPAQTYKEYKELQEKRQRGESGSSTGSAGSRGHSASDNRNPSRPEKREDGAHHQRYSSGGGTGAQSGYTRGYSSGQQQVNDRHHHSSSHHVNASGGKPGASAAHVNNSGGGKSSSSHGSKPGGGSSSVSHSNLSLPPPHHAQYHHHSSSSGSSSSSSSHHYRSAPPGQQGSSGSSARSGASDTAPPAYRRDYRHAGGEPRTDASLETGVKRPHDHSASSAAKKSRGDGART